MVLVLTLIMAHSPDEIVEMLDGRIVKETEMTSENTSLNVRDSIGNLIIYKNEPIIRFLLFVILLLAQ